MVADSPDRPVLFASQLLVLSSSSMRHIAGSSGISDF
jgi:hypothetical protein